MHTKLYHTALIRVYKGSGQLKTSPSPLVFIILDCTALYFTALHYTRQYYIAVHHCTAPTCTALQCTTLDLTTLHLPALHCPLRHSIKIHCTVHLCPILHHTASFHFAPGSNYSWPDDHSNWNRPGQSGLYSWTLLAYNVL